MNDFIGFCCKSADPNMFHLPREIQQLIYSFDGTYRDAFKDVIAQTQVVYFEGIIEEIFYERAMFTRRRNECLPPFHHYINMVFLNSKENGSDYYTEIERLSHYLHNCDCCPVAFKIFDRHIKNGQIIRPIQNDTLLIETEHCCCNCHHLGEDIIKAFKEACKGRLEDAEIPPIVDSTFYDSDDMMSDDDPYNYNDTDTDDDWLHEID